ncbi:LOW QUALITY PROTEIN: hypothetical protein V2J09_021007 [Rumex salicifolius]
MSLLNRRHDLMAIVVEVAMVIEAEVVAGGAPMILSILVRNNKFPLLSPLVRSKRMEEVSLLLCPRPYKTMNGAVERRHQIVQEKGLALLAQASLPFDYWEHAFHTTVYLSNRTITPLQHNKSPFQLLYSKNPDYRLLKTFGCACYPYLRPYNSTKLAFRSLPCLFIGYNSKHKGYVCLHLPIGRIYISAHVIFDEALFPYKHPFVIPASSSTQTSSKSSPTSTLLLQLTTDASSPHLPSPTPQPSTMLEPSPSPSPSQPIQPTVPVPSPSTTPNPEGDLAPVPAPQHPTLSHLRTTSDSSHSMTTRTRTGSLTHCITNLLLRTLVDSHTSWALKSRNTMHLSQHKYLRDLLARCAMLDAKPISSPADSSITKLTTGTDPPYSDVSAYRHVVGSLQSAIITCPEISFVVNRACQHMHNPLSSHWQHVKRNLRYLKGTLDHGITLSASSSTDLATDPSDLRSQHGFVVYFGGNIISWSSRKQKVQARSSTEAEYRALAFTTVELVWLRQLLHEIGFPLKTPPVLLCDNLSATFLANNPVITTQSKHIQLDYHFVREQIDSKLLIVRHIPAGDQVVDVFTKALTGRFFTHLCPKLRVLPRPSACWGVSIEDMPIS